MDDGHSQRVNKAELTAFIVLLLLGVGLVGWLLMNRPTVSQQQTPTKSSPARAQLAYFATGLPNPTGIVSTGIQSDARLFVLDQNGLIRILKDDGSVASQPFLDISGKVIPGGETGLLGLAFSPHYASDGYFYVDYVDKKLNTIIARYHVSSDAGKADPTSEQIVLTQPQPYYNHNGGQLAFGLDGYLYIGFGDGGSAGDPENRAQNLSTWLGKILRIDVAALPYKTPRDNPFVTQKDAKPEIWDLGLRNPWRFSFDRKTHELYIADVGQGAIEELDVESAGKGGNNYGWRCYEGDKDFKLDGCKTRDTYTFPVLTYDHADGRCSVTGGYVYRGSKYPGLDGRYFYGDYCSGQVYWAEKQNGKWTQHEVADTPFKISTFGQANNGELYVADYPTGTIYQIQATN